MKFSIIIPTYNSCNGLSKTIGSIFAQSFIDYEVVIIDGASTDDTLSVIKSYEKIFFDKIKFISESDEGIYDAMNKGIKLAKGEYLYFMGAGDVFYDNTILQKISNELQDRPDIVYGNVQRGDSKNVYDGEFSREKLIEKNISHQAIFYSRKIFENFGNYDLKYPILADWEFNMRWLSDKSIKSKYVDQVIATFELGGSSKKIFDQNFYTDFEKNIKKYFPKECWKVYEEKKACEMRFVTNETKWKVWEMKNKVEFIFKNPKKFITKYMKK